MITTHGMSCVHIAPPRKPFLWFKESLFVDPFRIRLNPLESSRWMRSVHVWIDTRQLASILGHRSNQPNIRCMDIQPEPVQAAANGHNILHISRRCVRTGRYLLGVVSQEQMHRCLFKNITVWGYWKDVNVYGAGTSRQGAPWFEVLIGEYFFIPPSLVFSFFLSFLTGEPSLRLGLAMRSGIITYSLPHASCLIPNEAAFFILLLRSRWIWLGMVHPFTWWDDLCQDRHGPKKLQQAGKATTFIVAIARPSLWIVISVIIYGEPFITSRTCPLHSAFTNSSAQPVISSHGHNLIEIVLCILCVKQQFFVNYITCLFLSMIWK